MIRKVIDYIHTYDAGIFPEDLEKAQIINLGSNENPFPLPRNVVEAICRSAENVNRYPNPKYEKLKERIAEYCGVNRKNISIGNGASDVLENACKISLEPLDKVVMKVPTYSMYIFLGMLRDADVFFVKSYEDLVEESKNSKLTFICSPNNPTGETFPKKVFEEIMESTNGIVVVDEAYYEFCKETFLDYINDYKNLIIVRSFSKFFGLAGLRIGYAVASKKVIEALEKVRLPFNVNSLGVEAAMEALKSIEYFERVRDYIVRERERLIKEINKISGFKAFESKANFILVKAWKNVSEELAKKGIIVRDVSDVVGLEGNYLRITVGKREENDALIKELRCMGNLNEGRK